MHATHIKYLNLLPLLWIIPALFIAALADNHPLRLVYFMEDGVVEWISVLLLIASFSYALNRASYYYNRRLIFWGYTLFAVFCFFVAGEEISWGQRLIGLTTPAFMLEHNMQNEFNLHNIEIANQLSISRLGGIIFIFLLLIYTFVLPVIYRKVAAVKSFFDHHAIPIMSISSVCAIVGYIIILKGGALYLDSGVGNLDEMFETTIYFFILLSLTCPMNKSYFPKQ